jgi:hypothetical protein
MSASVERTAAKILAWQVAWAKVGLSAAETVTVLALGKFMDEDTLETFASLVTLCEVAGDCHVSMIARGTKRLEKRGALAIVKGGGRGKRTEYRGFMPSPKTVAAPKRAPMAETPMQPPNSGPQTKYVAATVSAALPATVLSPERVAETLAATRARYVDQVDQEQEEQQEQQEEAETQHYDPRRDASGLTFEEALRQEAGTTCTEADPSKEAIEEKGRKDSERSPADEFEAWLRSGPPPGDVSRQWSLMVRSPAFRDLSEQRKDEIALLVDEVESAA